MPSEIEAKMKIDAFEELRARLIERGAYRLGMVLETNTFFDTPERSLIASDKGLRLRRNHHLETGRDQFVITVKGPQQAGAFKNRQEAEAEVGDGQGASAVLAALGFEPTLSFEKRRESWRLGDCKVELDELPILGRFVEIEGPDENAVASAREKLGLSNLPPIKTGYVTMLARHLKETNDTRRSVTF